MPSEPQLVKEDQDHDYTNAEWITMKDRFNLESKSLNVYNAKNKSKNDILCLKIIKCQVTYSLNWVYC